MAVKKKTLPKEKALKEEVSKTPDDKEVTQENQTVNSFSLSEKKPVIDIPNETLDSTPIAGNSQNSIDNNEEKTSIEKELWDDEKKDGSSFKKALLYFGIFIILGLVTAGIAFFSYQFAYKKGVEVGEKNAQKKLASQIPTNTPTPTIQEEDVKLSEYSIKVLNGSGINGEASKLKSILEDDGYTVSDIGNSEKDYEKTIIQAKSDVSKAWLEKLKKTLEKSYTLDDTLPLDKEDSDVVISIGSLKKE